MICGTPSVTTSIGAEGMCGNFPWNGFIEDDFADFAFIAAELYTKKNLWQNAQKTGIDIINEIYDKEKISQLFVYRMQEIQRNLEQHRTHNFLGSLLQHQSLQATKYMSKWIEAKNQ